MRRRVVITGLGVISPVGNDARTMWQNIKNSMSGFAPVTTFDTAIFPNHIGAEVKNLNNTDILSASEKRIIGKASTYAICAAYQALQESKALKSTDHQRVGVVMGTTFGEAGIVEESTRLYIKERIHKPFITQYSPNSISVNIAKKFKLFGPNFVVPTACAAGNYAVGYGAKLIKANAADAMIVGGADPFSHVSFSGFSRLGVMATETCQPFDKNRRGMIVGEGAGVIVLEEYNHAKSRNAHMYAEVLGCGISCDANHMTIPDVSGVVSMIKNALQIAGLRQSDIDYICAHGTGTKMNDQIESQAIRSVFYEAGNNVPVSSLKSMMGHTMGAASAIETIACALGIYHETIPPTANFLQMDPDCNIDCVPNKPRSKKLKYVLNNALAFGGNNAALILASIN